MNSHTDGRIKQMPLAPGRPCIEDSAVLRLSRESLRSERPEVRFIGRVGSQQRLPWPA